MWIGRYAWWEGYDLCLPFRGAPSGQWGKSAPLSRRRIHTLSLQMASPSCYLLFLFYFSPSLSGSRLQYFSFILCNTSLTRMFYSCYLIEPSDKSIDLSKYDVTNEAAETQRSCGMTQYHTAKIGQIWISWLASRASHAVSYCFLF